MPGPGQTARWPLVQCPVCKAPPGQRCLSMDVPAYRGAARPVQRPHPARITEATRTPDSPVPR